ncbi:hypothetical protein [Streptomyces sp. DSM 118148]|uniref:hypothetical protein n=1 Tax=Streptomyces sp. DSM 118148 TaxID=3448667 RepID=UPI0040401D17
MAGPLPGPCARSSRRSTFGAGWTTTGDFAGTGPRREKLDGSLGDGVLDTFATADDTGDQGTGTITSPEFAITRKYIDFLIAGGNHPQNGDAPTAFNLLVDGEVVRTATGKDSGTMDWTSWDVGDLIGKKAVLQATDRNTGGWGHIMADNVVLSDHAAPPIDRQTPSTSSSTATSSAPPPAATARHWTGTPGT